MIATERPVHTTNEVCGTHVACNASMQLDSFHLAFQSFLSDISSGGQILLPLSAPSFNAPLYPAISDDVVERDAGRRMSEGVAESSMERVR